MDDVETAEPATYEDGKTSVFSFMGRIGTRRFAFLTLAPYAFAFVAAIMAGSNLEKWADPTRQGISAIGSFLVGWITMATWAKRNHDLGKSGWRALIQTIPLFNFIEWIHLVRTKGQEEPNEYGPPPESNSYLE